jgi:threonine/homoserine/homoserine lactone efflux protein
MHFPVDPSRFVAFLGIMLAMAFAPGPANIFCMATGMQKGKRAALLGVAGLNSATLIWFFAAALGLGTLIRAFPYFFHYLAYAGSAYVFYLGIMSLRETFAKKLNPIVKIKISKRTPFHDGFIVQIANPKVLLFFTAVLPPFIDLSQPLTPQLLIFAFTTISADVTAMCGYGLGGSALGKRAEDSRFRRGFALAVGLLLLTAALLIALES